MIGDVTADGTLALCASQKDASTRQGPQLVGRLVGWLVGWLAGWLTGWLVGWLVGWLTGWLVAWLVGRLVGWGGDNSSVLCAIAKREIH